MTTKLDLIKEMVAKHFKAKEEHDKNYEEYQRTGLVTITISNGYNSNQHAAMCLLRDLLPLLETAVIWDDIRWDTEKGERVKRLVNLHTEIVKLKEEQ